MYQISRIAIANNLPETTITALVSGLIKKRSLGVFGEPRVNVLELNIALDQLRIAHGRATPQP
jgi:K+-transporting ATPase ATPase C chain